jgi:hypothetical protein
MFIRVTSPTNVLGRGAAASGLMHCSLYSSGRRLGEAAPVAERLGDASGRAKRRRPELRGHQEWALTAPAAEQGNIGGRARGGDVGAVWAAAVWAR